MPKYKVQYKAVEFREIVVEAPNADAATSVAENMYSDELDENSEVLKVNYEDFDKGIEVSDEDGK